MFKVIAKMVVKPEKSEIFKENVAKLAPQTRQYPGCISYELLQSREDENVFLFHETWSDDKAFEEHFKADFTKEFEKSLEGIAAKEVEPYICSIVV